MIFREKINKCTDAIIQSLLFDLIFSIFMIRTPLVLGYVRGLQIFSGKITYSNLVEYTIQWDLNREKSLF